MAIFSRNEANRNGHTVLQVTSLDSRTGEEELEQLKKAGVPVEGPVTACLQARHYRYHKLAEDHEYTVVIIPGSNVPPEAGSTVEGLATWASKTYKYARARAGIALRLRDLLSVSPELMEKLKLERIIVVHDPTDTRKEGARVFGVRVEGAEGFLDAYAEDETAYGEGTGFAFIDLHHVWSKRS